MRIVVIGTIETDIIQVNNLCSTITISHEIAFVAIITLYNHFQ